MIFHASPGIIDLGINIDHVATLRNARGTTYPDPIAAALLAEEAGADLITLHLREDRRHIKDADVRALRPQLRTRMNLECAVTQEMLDIACDIGPQDVCLVPERRQLRARFKVAGKQDHAARQWMGNASNIVEAEFQAGNIQNDRAWTLLLLGLSHAEDLVCNSATAKATA